MRWLSLIFSFLLGRFDVGSDKRPHFSLQAIYDEVAVKSRGLIALTLIGTASIILLCGGLFISLINATAQYDRNNIIIFSATFVAGLVLAVIGGIVFAVVFMKAWPGASKPIAKEAEAPRSTGIETAISALIMDFVKEREMKRAQRPQSFDSSFAQGKSEEQRPYNPTDEIPPMYHS